MQQPEKKDSYFLEQQTTFYFLVWCNFTFIFNIPIYKISRKVNKFASHTKRRNICVYVCFCHVHWHKKCDNSIIHVALLFSFWLRTNSVREIFRKSLKYQVYHMFFHLRSAKYLHNYAYCTRKSCDFSIEKTRLVSITYIFLSREFHRLQHARAMVSVFLLFKLKNSDWAWQQTIFVPTI